MAVYLRAHCVTGTGSRDRWHGRRSSSIITSLAVGEILQRTGSDVPIFIIAGSAYLIALLIVHLLVPNLEPAHVN